MKSGPLALSLCLLLASSLPSRAEQPCPMTGPAAKADIIRANPDAKEIGKLTGADVKTAIAEYNALPPVSRIEADAAFVMIRPGVDTALVVFTLSGCVSVWDEIPVPVVARWLGEGA